jgi:hypothetical protein
MLHGKPGRQDTPLSKEAAGTHQKSQHIRRCYFYDVFYWPFSLTRSVFRPSSAACCRPLFISPGLGTHTNLGCWWIWNLPEWSQWMRFAKRKQRCITPDMMSSLHRRQALILIIVTLYISFIYKMQLCHRMDSSSGSPPSVIWLFSGRHSVRSGYSGCISRSFYLHCWRWWPISPPSMLSLLLASSLQESLSYPWFVITRLHRLCSIFFCQIHIM